MLNAIKLGFVAILYVLTRSLQPRYIWLCIPHVWLKGEAGKSMIFDATILKLGFNYSISTCATLVTCVSPTRRYGSVPYLIRRHFEGNRVVDIKTKKDGTIVCQYWVSVMGDCPTLVPPSVSSLRILNKMYIGFV